MKKGLFVTLTLLILFVFSLLLDRVAGLFGFPVETPKRYAHPGNYKEHRKNIEYEYEFITNSQGLRYKEIPLAKPEKESRIFMAGDSFTEGVGVNANETISSFLEEHFNSRQDKHIAFINGGLSAAGPLEYWKVFFNVGLKYKPDGLLICLYENDVSDMPESIRPEDFYSHPTERQGIKKLLHGLYPRVYTALVRLKDQYVFRQRTKPPDFVEAVSNEAMKIGIPEEKIVKWKKNLPRDLVSAVNRGEFAGAVLSYGLLRPWLVSDSLDIDTDRAERKYQSMIITLEKIIKEAAERGIEVGIIYIPIKFQYDPSMFMPDRPWIRAGAYCRKSWLSGQCELQKRLEQWTTQKKLPFLDLTPTLREAMKGSKRLAWDIDPHLNREGNRVASIAISNWIEGKKLFSCIK